MLRVICLTTLLTCSAALRVTLAPEDKVGKIPIGLNNGVVQKNAACGVVTMAFGKEYNKLGNKVTNLIRSLNVSKGWCPEDPELDHIPIAFFTDADASECPKGVQCLPENAMPPWEGPQGAVPLLNSKSSHLGDWKFRWYHAQGLINSPYPWTLYVDLDALPCSGEGVTALFQTMKAQGASVGSITHEENHIKVTPKELSAEDKKDWGKYEERNAGSIMLYIPDAKPMLEEWAAGIRTGAEDKHVTGDQLAYRAAMFSHRKTIKEHIFKDNEICRNLSRKRYNCQNGCYIMHKPNNGALKDNGIM
jgi:hypothetical protein